MLTKKLANRLRFLIKGQSSRCTTTVWMDFDMQNNSNILSSSSFLATQKNCFFFFLLWTKYKWCPFWVKRCLLSDYFVQLCRFVVIVLKLFDQKLLTVTKRGPFRLGDITDIKFIPKKRQGEINVILMRSMVK